MASTSGALAVASAAMATDAMVSVWRGRYTSSITLPFEAHSPFMLSVSVATRSVTAPTEPSGRSSSAPACTPSR
jgi:hypothetical protein